MRTGGSHRNPVQHLLLQQRQGPAQRKASSFLVVGKSECPVDAPTGPPTASSKRVSGACTDTQSQIRDH